MATRLSLLKSLTHAELKEVGQRYGVGIPAGLKKAAAVKYLAEHLPLSDSEIQSLVESYQLSKLVQKIRDAGDYFLTRQVTIDHADDDLIKARVAGYTVVITHLGDDLFSYQCDRRCNDWQYQVKGGRYPFCKHYAAVVAELVFSGRIDPGTDPISHFTPALLDELIGLVETRRSQEGISAMRGRDIEETLEGLRTDFLAIAQQNAEVAREKYHDAPERVFEHMVEQCFQLLEFDTICRRKEQGWDLLALGTLAVPPFIIVIEAKTAQSGLYDYVVRNPDYLIRLKSYAVDMVRERLFGVYRDYVKYFLMVAPGFPEDARKLSPQFRHMTQGIKLSFLPAPVLLHLVMRYRAEPVLTHTLLEQVLGSEQAISQADVDALFDEAHYTLDQLVVRARKDLRRKMEGIADRAADACFIKFDLPSLGMIFRDVMRALEEELVVVGKTPIGTESVHVKHDYYALWRAVLTGLVDEFADILEEESSLQERQTALKNDVMRFLELER